MSNYEQGPPGGGFTPPPGGGYGGPPSGGAFGPPSGGGGAFGPPSGGGMGTPGGPAGPTGPKMDALAIVALVCGLIAIVGATGNLVSGFFGMCCFLCTLGGAIIGALVAIPAIVAIVTGILSFRRTKAEPHLFKGGGLALAGLITGILALLMTIFTIVAPMAGLGCMMANAPDQPRTTQDPWNPFAIDAGTGSVIPTPPPPVDPSTIGTGTDTTGTDTTGNGTTGGACQRLGPCCRAYVAAMGNMPATTCDAYNTIPAGMTDSMCDQTMAGYRSGLTVMNRAVPAECN
jgi:hypothetical protein